MENAQTPAFTYILLTCKPISRTAPDTQLEYVRGVINIRVIKYHKLFNLKSFKKYMKTNLPDYKSSLHYLFNISDAQTTNSSINPFQHIHLLIMSRARSECIHYAESTMTYEQINFISTLQHVNSIVHETLHTNFIPFRRMDT